MAKVTLNELQEGHVLAEDFVLVGNSKENKVKRIRKDDIVIHVDPRKDCMLWINEPHGIGDRRYITNKPFKSTNGTVNTRITENAIDLEANIEVHTTGSTTAHGAVNDIIINSTTTGVVKALGDGILQLDLDKISSGGGADIPDVAKSVMSPKYSISSRGGDEDKYVKVEIGDEVRITFKQGTGFREHVEHDMTTGLWTVPSSFKGNWNIEFNQMMHSPSVRDFDNMGSNAPNWRFRLYQSRLNSNTFTVVDQFDYQNTYLPLNMRMPIDFFWKILAYDFDAKYYCTMELLSYGKPNGDNEVFIPRQKPVVKGQEALYNTPKNAYGYTNESPHPSIMYTSDVVLSSSSYIEF